MLPKQKTKPKPNLFEHVIFLYGAPKIGKSTLVSEIPDVLFLNAGGGLDALEVYQTPIPDWETFLDTGAEILKGEHEFKVIAIDTIDRLHKLCVSYIMKQQKIIHPADLGFGKGWDMVKDEFIRPITRLALSKYGLILISHVTEREISTRTSKITKSIPTLQNYVWEQVDGLSGIILFFTSERRESGETRVIKTTPSETWVAGDRTTKLIGKDIVILPDGKNWERIQTIFKGDAI